jgi:hypothetical protein
VSVNEFSERFHSERFYSNLIEMSFPADGAGWLVCPEGRENLNWVKTLVDWPRREPVNALACTAKLPSVIPFWIIPFCMIPVRPTELFLKDSQKDFDDFFLSQHIPDMLKLWLFCVKSQFLPFFLPIPVKNRDPRKPLPPIGQHIYHIYLFPRSL